ncbi:MAG: pyridoxal phosphate-dependent aminotransferase [Gemmatimonadota bacterium]|nr:pyridoxal phosphate-dependent aminotransferase [Gemmatimonadota bacterium]
MATTIPQPAFAPSPNIARMRESATIAVSARAKALRAAGRNIIDLGAGEPDFDTPEFIRDAAKRAIDAGATRYTITEGILPLREAIAAHVNEVYSGPDRAAAGDVVVSTGSKQALFNACFVLFGAGDEVLIPTPSWTSYYEIVSLARATPVAVLGDPANGLKVVAGALERAATTRTRGIMLNSPCNPTGAVYSRDELDAIVTLATERGWWLISDQIYQRISYDGPAPEPLDVARSRERLIVVDGVAKAYAMTGWRIGWATAPRAVAASMAALQSHTTRNPAAVSQQAALAALTERTKADAAVTAMVSEFRVRRDMALEILREEPRLPFVHPEGAFYLFCDVSATGSGDNIGGAFAQRLLDERGIAIVPGSAFHTPGWVRMSYAAPREHVAGGARAIVDGFRASLR